MSKPIIIPPKLVAVKYTGDLATVTNAYGEFSRGVWRTLPETCLAALSSEFTSRELNDKEAASVAADPILGTTAPEVIIETPSIPAPSNPATPLPLDNSKSEPNKVGN